MMANLMQAAAEPPYKTPSEHPGQKIFFALAQALQVALQVITCDETGNADHCAPKIPGFDFCPHFDAPAREGRRKKREDAPGPRGKKTPPRPNLQQPAEDARRKPLLAHTEP